MFKKIAHVKPQDGFRLLVFFVGGEAVVYDASLLFEESPSFLALKKDGLFFQAAVDVGGYSIVWNDELDVASNEIYARGRHVEIVQACARAVVSDIASCRRCEGFSQARLAAACGVAQPVIARVETGESDPRLSTLLKILAPLGKTLEVADLGEERLSGSLERG